MLNTLKIFGGVLSEGKCLQSTLVIKPDNFVNGGFDIFYYELKHPGDTDQRTGKFAALSAPVYSFYYRGNMATDTGITVD